MCIDAEDAPATAHDVAEAAGVWHRGRGQGEGGVHPVPVWLSATTPELVNCEMRRKQIGNLNETI